jgi:hypothetical protein
VDFPRLFADAGEDDLAGGDPGGQGAVELPAGDDVGAAALVGEEAEDGQIGIGLDGEGGQMGEPREGAVEGPEMLPERPLAVDIARRADGARNPRQRDLFTP